MKQIYQTNNARDRERNARANTGKASALPQSTTALRAARGVRLTATAALRAATATARARCRATTARRAVAKGRCNILLVQNCQRMTRSRRRRSQHTTSAASAYAPHVDFVADAGARASGTLRGTPASTLACNIGASGDDNGANVDDDKSDYAREARQQSKNETKYVQIRAELPTTVGRNRRCVYVG